MFTEAHKPLPPLSSTQQPRKCHARIMPTLEARESFRILNEVIHRLKSYPQAQELSTGSWGSLKLSTGYPQGGGVEGLGGAILHILKSPCNILHSPYNPTLSRAIKDYQGFESNSNNQSRNTRHTTLAWHNRTHGKQQSFLTNQGIIMAKTESGIIYQGPSMIDGSPIVCVAVYREGKGVNAKTGAMVQTYIIRADIDPITANRTGLDYAICGSCKHRGTADTNKAAGLAVGRSCYVNIGQGPLQVYKAFTRGNYKALTTEQITAIGANRMVRLGTYGDAGALPQDVVKALLSASKGHTGYTHQLGTVEGFVPGVFMVSADSKEEAVQAHSKGYRTFRVIPITDNSGLLHNEIECPSSRGIQCVDCGLCKGGTVGKSIAIVAHGAGASNF